MPEILFSFGGRLLINTNFGYNLDLGRWEFMIFHANKMIRDSGILYNSRGITQIRDRSKKLCHKYWNRGINFLSGDEWKYYTKLASQFRPH